MNQALTHGLPAVVVAAALYGCAPVLQAASVRRAAPAVGLGLRLLPRLAVQPLWLLGTACGIAAFAAEAYAFSVAPAALVAPLITLDMVFLVLLARHGLSERLGIAGALGILAMVLGTALIAFAFSGDAELGAPASHAQLLAFLVGGTAAAGAAAVRRGPREPHRAIVVGGHRVRGRLRRRFRDRDTVHPSDRSHIRRARPLARS